MRDLCVPRPLASQGNALGSTRGKALDAVTNFLPLLSSSLKRKFPPGAVSIDIACDFISPVDFIDL